MPGPLDLVAFVVCVAAALVAPLGLGLALPDPRKGTSRARRRLRFLIVGAGLGLPFAFADKGGDYARLASAWWVVVTIVTAFFVVRRFVSSSRLRLSEVLLTLAYVELPVGAVWLHAYLTDRTLLGYSGLRVLLTAAHFHFAGMGALLLAGGLGRTRDASGKLGRLFDAGAVAFALSVPLLAVGIAWSRPVEHASAWVVAAGMVVMALFAFLHARRVRSTQVMVMLGFAGASALCSAALAAWFSTKGFAELDAHTLEVMVTSHGMLNALGVVTLGVAGLSWESPAPRRNRAGMPVSELRAGLVVGPSFFETSAAADPVGEVHGLVDRFDDFGVEVAPEVARFYERTDEYALHVVPHWRLAFRPGGALFSLLGGLFGQLALPRSSDRMEAMKSRLVPLREVHDGRPKVRGWVRTRTREGRDDEAVYVAAYATHREGETTYMNIAFPLPLSSMTSVLRLAPLPGGALSLTSRGGASPEGDQGVYLVTWPGIVRLPLDETIEVSPADGEAVDGVEGPVVLRAEHVMWIFGIEYLRLRYWIVRRDPAA